MKNILIFISLLISFNTFSSQKYSTELFCQDINVLLQKIQSISSNIANAHTTRTPEGGHYKRKVVKNCKLGKCEIISENKPPILTYEPNHPDADDTGYVAYPSISVKEEMANMIKAQRVYEAVWAAGNVKDVDLLVGNKFDECRKNYVYFRDSFNFKEYLGRD